MLAFYTMPEYEAWKDSLGGTPVGWDVKYYKGLGTSTRDEAREYFSALDEHRKEFIWEGELLPGGGGGGRSGCFGGLCMSRRGGGGSLGGSAASDCNAAVLHHTAENELNLRAGVPQTSGPVVFIGLLLLLLGGLGWGCR